MQFKMVEPILWGGLGNQMFIYATARALSLRTDARLIIDGTKFNDNFKVHRSYSLDIFSFDNDGMPINMHYWIYKINRRFRERREMSVNSLPCNWFGKLRLTGYWQSEGYFADYAEIIRADFTLKNADLIRNSEIGRQIENCDNSVFVHVRSFHEAVGSNNDSRVLPLAYYENAIRYLISRIDGTPVFFLFSDEPDFASQWLKPIEDKLGVVMIPVCCASIVAPGADLQLMRMCRHAIVGNSSFSWWGAWLGEQDNKVNGRSGMVVCPEGLPFPEANRDFYPKRWPRISRLAEGRMCYDALVAWGDEDGCVVHQLNVRGLVYARLPREFSDNDLLNVKHGCSKAKTILVVAAYNYRLPLNFKQQMTDICMAISNAEVAFKVLLFGSQSSFEQELISGIVLVQRAMSDYDTEYTSGEWAFLDSLGLLQRPVAGYGKLLCKLQRSLAKKISFVGLGIFRRLVN